MKFDIMMLRGVGIEVRGAKWDTMLLHYLLDPESRHNMDFLAERYLRYSPIRIETLIGKGTRQLTMDQVNIEAVKEYAAEDADITLQLKNALWPELEKQGLVELYHTIEEPMIEVLAEMEQEGFLIDRGALVAFGEMLTERIDRAQAAIYELAGEQFNINSTQQLGHILLTSLACPR